MQGPEGQSWDQSSGRPESKVRAPEGHSTLPTALLVGTDGRWSRGAGRHGREWVQGRQRLLVLLEALRGLAAGQGSSDLGGRQEPLLSHCWDAAGEGACDAGEGRV